MRFSRSLFPVFSFLLFACSLLPTPCLAHHEDDPIFPALSGYSFTPGETYTSQTLWNIIDGAAEVFLEFGFIDMRVGEYLSADSIDIRIEMYHHSSPLNAFGMYSQERSPGYHFVDVGSQGYREKDVLNFICGEYYVKISTHAETETGYKAIEKCAHEVDRKLARPKYWPEIFTIFPKEGRILNSESYLAENFLGYSYLAGAYVVQYGETEKVFVVPFATLAAAESAAAKYTAAIEMQGKLADGEIREVNDKNTGKEMLLLKGKYLCGEIGFTNPDILVKIRKGL